MSHQDWLTYQSFQHKQKTMLKAAENARLAKEAHKSQMPANRVLSTLKSWRNTLNKPVDAEQNPAATYSREPRFEN